MDSISDVFSFMKMKKSIAQIEMKEDRRARLEEMWRQLCSAQQTFMERNPDTRCTEIKANIYEAVFLKRVGDLLPRSDFTEFDEINFHNAFKTLINAEEAWEHTEMRKYDMKQVAIQKIGTRSRGYYRIEVLYRFSVPGLERGQPSLVPFDGLIMDDGSGRHFKRIVGIDYDTVTIQSMCLSLPDVLDEKRKYDISFVSSGFCFDKFLEALDKVNKTRHFKEILFGASSTLSGELAETPAKIDYSTSGTEELDERVENLNCRQKQAIKHILEAKCRPNLYILFGPPGTGKTSTIVETVVQIYQRDKMTSILICSSSNTCVDDIAAKIYETGQVDSMIRLCSKQHFKQLTSVSKYTTIICEDACSTRVVITTNMMVSRTPCDFDYVLVDEAGHAHVLETMIPMTKLNPDGCLVLAGDPRQLGPVIKCFEVEKLGLGKSLLERMCERNLYQKRGGQYDEKYITKLVKSYRCDPNILGICNDLFYDGDLECLGKTPASLLKILNIEKQLVHVRVAGQEKSPGTSTSRCNYIESDACIKILIKLYKMGLEPEQIGVITPYALQREVLSKTLKRQLEQDRPLLDQRFGTPSSKLDWPLESAKQMVSDFRSNRSNRSNLKESYIDFLSEALRTIDLEEKVAKSRSTPIEDYQPIDWLCKIDTVDAFQGGEREVIIVSTVRTPDGNDEIDQCGFLADAKRFNVTISRAKWLVIVVGHPAVLDCCEYWKQFSRHASKVQKLGNVKYLLKMITECKQEFRQATVILLATASPRLVYSDTKQGPVLIGSDA